MILLFLIDMGNYTRLDFSDRSKRRPWRDSLNERTPYMQEPSKSCLQCNAQNQMSAAFCYSCGAHFQPPVAQQRSKKKGGTILLIICGVLVFSCAGLTAIWSLLRDYVSTRSATPTPVSTTPTPASATSTPVSTLGSPTPNPSSVAEGPYRVGVTLANYNRLQTGMTYDQVRQILGKEGTVRIRANTANFVSLTYAWKGDDSGELFGIFHDDKLVKKSEYALK
jgi:ribosomal protein L40E